MAEAKYLDSSGLSRVWAKIKSYLSSNYATKSALNSGLSGKANSSHTHTTGQITSLASYVDGRINNKIGDFENGGTISLGEGASIEAGGLGQSVYLRNKFITLEATRSISSFSNAVTRFMVDIGERRYENTQTTGKIAEMIFGTCYSSTSNSFEYRNQSSVTIVCFTLSKSGFKYNAVPAGSEVTLITNMREGDAFICFSFPTANDY